jgi:hypothetical protein
MRPRFSRCVALARVASVWVMGSSQKKPRPPALKPEDAAW